MHLQTGLANYIELDYVTSPQLTEAEAMEATEECDSDATEVEDEKE
jgi:hypothetical protein